MSSCKATKCRKRKDLNGEGFCSLHSKDLLAECVVCSLTVNPTDEALGCDLCQKWHHFSCISSGDQSLYKALIEDDKNLKGIKWFCQICLEVIDQFTSTTYASSATVASLADTDSDSNKNNTGDIVNEPCSSKDDVGNSNESCFKSSQNSIMSKHPGPPRTFAKDLMSNSDDTRPTGIKADHKENNKNSVSSDTPICRQYRRGRCNKGVDCNFSHPAKCLNYCRYGRDGCPNGFAQCKLLHPVLCRSSLRSKQCFDEGCTLTHLKGTTRVKFNGKGNMNSINNEQPMQNGYRPTPVQVARNRRYNYIPAPMHDDKNANMMRDFYPPPRRNEFWYDQNHYGYEKPVEWTEKVKIHAKPPPQDTFLDKPKNVETPVYPNQRQSKSEEKGNFLELKERMMLLQNQISNMVAQFFFNNQQV